MQLYSLIRAAISIATVGSNSFKSVLEYDEHYNICNIVCLRIHKRYAAYSSGFTSSIQHLFLRVILMLFRVI